MSHLFTWLKAVYDVPSPYTAELQKYTPPKAQPSTLFNQFIADLLEVTGSGRSRIWDACATEPVAADAGAYDETGRGLLFIEAYSRWGLYHSPGEGAGKVIWAKFPKHLDEMTASAT